MPPPYPPRPYKIPEIVVPGKRLGGGIHHDPRSLRYTLPGTDTFVSVVHERHIPILDQDPLGSCVPNTGVGALGTDPLWPALMRLFPTVPALDEALAIKLYTACEKRDGGVGWPPEDNGTYGLTVAKVMKDDGYISGYVHAKSLAAAHTAIQAGPFMMGSNWYSGMDNPDAEGIVKPTGYVRGRHEYLFREYDAARDLWWADNSWGTSFGIDGRFAYDSVALGYLLSQRGDITSLVPLTEPAPTPGPAPDLSVSFTADEFGALEDWSRYPHLWHKATVAARAWKAATDS